MQHPDGRHIDEGTIHAWLDGALDAAEGARVEAHVADCAACAAAVAEARGLVAAASRILGALDTVPAAVTTPGRVPAAVRAPRRPWWARPGVRAAAALLVVAGGTVVVMRSDGPGKREAEWRTIPAVAQRVVGPAERAPADSAASLDASAPAPASGVALAPPLTPAPEPVPAPERAASRATSGAPGAAGAAGAPAPTAVAQAAAPPPSAPAPRGFQVLSAPVPPSSERMQSAPDVAMVEARRVMADSVASRAKRVGADSLTADLAARASRQASFVGRAVAADQAAGGRADSASLDRRRVAASGAAPGAARREAGAGAAAPSLAAPPRPSPAPSAAPSAAAPTASPAAVAALAGCHAVTLGTWGPASGGAEEAVPPVVGLPARVLLDTTLAPEPMAYGLALRAAPGTAAGAFRLAYWTPLSAASARLVWRAGAAEVDARVSRVTSADGVLRGTATWAAGDRAPAWRAPIELARVPCPVR